MIVCSANSLTRTVSERTVKSFDNLDNFEEGAQIYTHNANQKGIKTCSITFGVVRFRPVFFYDTTTFTRS